VCEHATHCVAEPTEKVATGDLMSHEYDVILETLNNASGYGRYRRRSAWEQISGRYAYQFRSNEATVVE